METKSFDLKVYNAKQQIDDALRVRPLAAPPAPPAQRAPHAYAMMNTQGQPAGAPQMGPPQGAPQPMAYNFAGMNAGADIPVGPGNLNVNVNAGNPQNPQGMGPQGFGVGYGAPLGAGQFNVGMQTDQNLAPQYIGGEYSNPGFSAGVGYMPQQDALSARLRVPFAEGGMATSVRENPEYHERDVDFLDTRNRHLREMVGKLAMAVGGHPSLSVFERGISRRRD